MSAGDPTITINVFAKTANANKALATTGQGVKQLGNAAGTATGQVNTMNGGLNRMAKSVGTLAAAYLGLRGAISAMRGLLSVNLDFEDSMASVRAVTAQNVGFTEAAFQRMQDEARRLGSTTRFAASEAAEGLKFLGMAGFTAEEATRSLQGTLQLAQAGNIGLGESADIVSNIMSAFGAEADETTNYVDLLAKTASTSNNSILELGDAMKFAAPILAGLKMEATEGAAAFGVLGNAGIKAGMAGAGLRMVLGQLAKENGPAVKALKSLGVAYSEINPQANSLAQIFQNLSRAGVDVSGVFSAFDARAANVAQVLVQNADELGTYTGKLRSAGGAAQEMADAMDNTLKGAFLRARSAIQEAALNIGEGFVPAVRAAAESLSGLVNRMNATGTLEKFGANMAKGFTALISVLSATTRAFSALNEMPGPLKFALKTMAVLWGINKIAASGFMLGTIAKGKSLGAAMWMLRLRLNSMGVQFNLLRAQGVTGFRAIGMAATAAGVSIKAAMISTGIGALIVGLGMLVEHLMSTKEAANQAAKSLRDVRRSSQDFNVDVNIGIDEATTLEQLDDLEDRIRERMKQIRRQTADAAEDADEDAVVEVKLLDGTIEEQNLREKINEIGQRDLSLMQSKLTEIEKQREVLAAQLEIEKEKTAEQEKQVASAKERKKLEDSTGASIKAEIEADQDEMMEGIGFDMEETVRIKAAGFEDIDAYEARLDELKNKRIMQALPGAPQMTDDELTELKELFALKEKLMEIDTRREEAAEATRDIDAELAILNAKINGQDELAKRLKQEQDIRKMTLALEKKGIEDAEKKARALVQAKAEAAEQDKKDQKQNQRADANLVADSIQSIGGGGGFFAGADALESSSARTADASERTADNTAAIAANGPTTPTVGGEGGGTTASIGTSAQSSTQTGLLSSMLEVLRGIRNDLGNPTGGEIAIS
jgi:TP901 family phage tail tape measure protein